MPNNSLLDMLDAITNQIICLTILENATNIKINVTQQETLFPWLQKVVVHVQVPQPMILVQLTQVSKIVPHLLVTLLHIVPRAVNSLTQDEHPEATFPATISAAPLGFSPQSVSTADEQSQQSMLRAIVNKFNRTISDKITEIFEENMLNNNRSSRDFLQRN